MSNIILLYQHASRELYSIRKLSSALKTMGNKVHVIQIDFEMDSAYKIAKNERIDLVITPWMYHEVNYARFVPFIEQNPKVKIINTHQEQISSIMSAPSLLPMKGICTECVYHLAWGDFFKQNLIKYNSTPEALIYITGNMRNDEMLDTKSKRAEFAKTYGLDPRKKWILYAECRDFVYSWTVQARYEFECKGTDQKDIDDFYNINKESLEKSLMEISNLPDEFFSKFEFIYRPHPGCLGTIKDKRCKPIADNTIYEWLKSVDLLVTWNSTSAYEADALNVPVLINEPIPNGPRLKAEGLEVYPIIQSLSEIMSIDLDKILDEQKKKKQYKKFFGEIDGKSTERVAQAIQTISKVNNDGYVAKVIPYKRVNIPNILYQTSLRFFVKTGLFDIVKYPRSAYAHRRDIPFYKGGTSHDDT